MLRKKSLFFLEISFYFYVYFDDTNELTSQGRRTTNYERRVSMPFLQTQEETIFKEDAVVGCHYMLLLGDFLERSKGFSLG